MTLHRNTIFFSCILLLCSARAFAYKVDIGYTALATELGAGIPDGNGVPVSQTEADTDGVAGPPYKYFPDITQSQFAGKIITNISNVGNTPSGHATSVGGYLYSTNSMASGIVNVGVYEVNSWLQSDYLMFGSTSRPLSSASRIGNHSWIGNTGNLAYDSDILRRLDWVIDTDEFVQCVGTNNVVGLNSKLLSAAYNVIAVGKTNGLHTTGSAQIDSTYVAGRTRTEIVAPLNSTSAATPVVAATAALLIELGHSNTALSDSYTTNRNGDIIYDAERSETIKAALLAGADRTTHNTTTSANITDYRLAPANQSGNGLDTRFGAGQVNVYNSYHIIAAGEQNSQQDDTAAIGNIAAHGFDYDAEFGGARSSNATASYYFSTGVNPQAIMASLAWNIDIAGGATFFDGSAQFYDLDLALYDVTSGQTLLVSSTSINDNSENVWASLPAYRNYLLQVTAKAGQGSFVWDYALAWRIEPDRDQDIVPDAQDNCPDIANFDQADSNNDGIGDACAPPVINGIWSDSTAPGTAVFVFGAYFDMTASQVSVNGINAPMVQVISPDMLIFLLPEGNVFGPVAVTTSHGTGTSSTNFGDSPGGLNITGIWPAEVSVGDFVFVFGSAFNDVATQVSVNGLIIPLVQQVSDSMLVFQVPAGISSGPVQVTTSTASVTSSSRLTVLP